MESSSFVFFFYLTLSKSCSFLISLPVFFESNIPSFTSFSSGNFYTSTLMRLVLLYFDEPVPHAPAVYHTMLLMVSDKSEINDQEQSITQTLCLVCKGSQKIENKQQKRTDHICHAFRGVLYSTQKVFCPNLIKIDTWGYSRNWRQRPSSI